MTINVLGHLAVDYNAPMERYAELRNERLLEDREDRERQKRGHPPKSHEVWFRSVEVLSIWPARQSLGASRPVGRKRRRRLSKEGVKRIAAEFTANPPHDLGYEERLKHIQELGNCDRKSAELVRDALPDEVWRRAPGRPSKNSAK
jgi:hypothetical protein